MSFAGQDDDDARHSGYQRVEMLQVRPVALKVLLCSSVTFRSKQLTGI
jgi:hypothetical protein